MKVNILHCLNIMTLMTCCASQNGDPRYDFWKGRNTVCIHAQPVYESNTGNQRKIVKKEKIVIADNIVQSISDQLKARIDGEQNAHNLYLLSSKNARIEHEKSLIEKTQMDDYYEFNEMLGEWAIADGKRNGPVEKAIWEDQEKPRRILSYVFKGTLTTASLGAFAAFKFLSVNSLQHSSYIAGLVSATLPAVSLASRDLAFLFEQKAVDYLSSVPLEVFNSNILQEGFKAFLEQARSVDGQQLSTFAEAFIKNMFSR